MNEYNIYNFTQRLRNLMYNRFPNLKDRGKNASGSFKHGLYNDEIRDVAFMKNPTYTITENQLTFDIGNAYAEQYYPYYHILQDTPYIRKRDKSTAKTRGSQAKVENLGNRDYNIIQWNGKSFTREYARNVRGKRNRLGNVSHYETDSAGRLVFVKKESNSYLNPHYQYIDKMLEQCVDDLGIEFNMKVLRVKHTGLEEDLANQWGTTPSNILDIFQSFEEDYGEDIIV